MQRLGGTLNFQAMDNPDADTSDLRRSVRSARGRTDVAVRGTDALAHCRRLRRGTGRLGEFADGEKAALQTIEAGQSDGDRWGIAVGNWVYSLIRRGQDGLTEAASYARTRSAPRPRPTTCR